MIVMYNAFVRPYESITAMWEWLIPLLKTALSNITTETVVDWGTCIATSSGKFA